MPTLGLLSVGSLANGTEYLIGQRFANEDLAIIFITVEPEKFLKFLCFQSIRPFSCYISDYVGPTSGQQRAHVGPTT